MTVERNSFLSRPDARGSGRLSADHIHSHKYIHTWAPLREIPPVCLSQWNEFRLMKEEEKVTVEESTYHWRTREEKRERDKKWGR